MKQSFITKVFSLLVLVCFGLGGAKAADLPLNTPISLTLYADSQEYTFTPSTDGILISTSENGQFSYTWVQPLTEDLTFTNDDGTHPMIAPTSQFITGKGYKTPVTAGTTYIFKVYSTGDTSVSFEFIDPQNYQLVIKEIKPAEGSVLYMTDPDNAGRVILMCDNFYGTYEKVQITSGVTKSGEFTANSEIAPGSVIGVDIIDAMKALYGKGVTAGSNITVKISGVKDDNGNLYNGTGEVTLNYTLGAKPIDIVSTTFPENQMLYSYYPASNTQYFDFVFDQDIDTTREGTYETVVGSGSNAQVITHRYNGPGFEFSVTTNNDACYQYLTLNDPNVEMVGNNTVRLKLAGLNLGDFNGLYSSDFGVSFKLMNIGGLDGQMAIGQPDQGNMGSYGYPVKYTLYEQLPLSSFNATWSPADQSSLASESTVTLRLGSNVGRIVSAQSMRFAYTDGTEKVVNAPLTSNGNGVFTATIPAEVKNKDNVRVRLNGIESADGFNYDNTFTVTYNPVAAAPGSLTIDPYPGSRIQSIFEFYIITDGTHQTGVNFPTINGSPVAGMYACQYNGKSAYLCPLNESYSINASDWASHTVTSDVTLNVHVPAGLFVHNGAANEAMDFTWVVGKEQTEPEPPAVVTKAMTVTPTANIYAIDKLVISSSNLALGFNGEPDADDVRLISPTGTNIEYEDGDFDGNTFWLSFPVAQTRTPGNYTLSLPQGFFTVGNDGAVSAAISQTITVKALNLTTSPAAGATVSGTASEAAISFVGNTVTLKPNTAYVDAPANKLNLKGNTIGWTGTLSDGKHTLVFPANSLTVDGVVVPYEVSLQYTVGVYYPFSIAVNGFEQDGTYANTGSTEAYTFTVVNAAEAPAYLAYDLVDNGTWIYGGAIECEDEVWTAYNNKVKLYVDHTYEFIISGYDNQNSYLNRRNNNYAGNTYKQSITFAGSTLPYVYSPVTVTANPAAGSVLPANASSIVLNFSAPVTVNAENTKVVMPMGTDGEAQDPVAFKSITASNGNKTWTLGLDPTASYMTDFVDLNLRVSAYDANGRYIAAGYQDEENSLILLSYTIDNGADMRPITANPANGAAVTNLTEIVISNPDYNVGLNNGYSGSPITLSYNGNTVNPNVVIANGEARLTLSSPIEYTGNVTLNIPERYFLLDIKEGTDYTYYSPALTATYTHTYEAPATPEIPEDNLPVNYPTEALVVTPANGSTVAEIREIKFSHSWYDIAKADAATPANAYIIKPNGQIVAFDVFRNDVDGYYTVGVLALNTPLTEGGTYTIHVPAGFFNCKWYITDDNVVCTNETINITYTIEGGGSGPITPDPDPTEIVFTTDPAVGSEHTGMLPATYTFTNEGLTFTWGSGSEQPYLLDGNGNKMSSYSVSLNFYGGNRFTIGGGNITAAGTYTVVIPANAMKINGKDYGFETRLSYTLLETQTVSVGKIEDFLVTVQGKGGNVEGSLDGREIRNVRHITFDFSHIPGLVSIEGNTESYQSLYVGWNGTYRTSGEYGWWDFKDDVWFTAESIADHVVDNVVIFDLSDKDITAGNHQLLIPDKFFKLTINTGGAAAPGQNRAAGTAIAYVPNNGGNPVEMNFSTIGAPTGLDTIIGDAAEGYRVYNLQGVLVLDTENASDLDRLPAGIYIINGKKVALR